MLSLRPAINRLTDGRVLSVALIAILVVIAIVSRLTGSADADTVEMRAQEAAPSTVGQGEPKVTPSGALASEVGSATWALDLLDALVVNNGPAPESEPYERDDYDSWIDADGDCQTTRHEVLIEESVGPIEFTDDRQCKVASGRWVDPYTGDIVTVVEQASIDHVVSLSEAHHAGAWAWTDAWKHALYNDIDDPATLAVSFVTVNQSKGSAGPDDWLPESADARCNYVIARVRDKARWQLSVEASEQQALERALATCVELQLPAAPTTAPFEIIDFSDDPVLPAPRATPRVTPGTCDARYPGVCIPMSNDDLNCADIDPRQFEIVDGDPHHFDGNGNAIACEGP